MIEYSYLNDETKQKLDLPIGERIRWVLNDHFVYYDQAEKILNHLDDVYNQKREKYRDMDSLTIYGYSGTGKSTIVLKFRNDHSGTINISNSEYIGVVYCLLPAAKLGLKGLFSSILRAEPLNVPLTEKRIRRLSVNELKQLCIKLLTEAGVHVLIVDEIQQALTGSEGEIDSILDTLKNLVQESGVPLVPVGTDRTAEVLARDTQLARRCSVKSYSKLDKWHYNDNFRSFLKSYQKFLPFPENSSLELGTMARNIFYIASLENYMGKVDVQAVKESLNKITPENLQEKTARLSSIVDVIKKISKYALEENSPLITEEYLQKYVANNI